METVGFPLPTSLRDILPSTTLHISGLDHAACLFACSSFVLPSLGLHVELAPDRLARRSSGGTCACGAHPLGNINPFHEIALNSKVSGLPWRDHALVRLEVPRGAATGGPCLAYPTVEFSCVCLFDYLIRLEEELRGEREPEDLGGLEIDDQLELRGLLHGQVGWRGALQDFIHVVGGAPPHGRLARPIGEQAPSFRVLSDGPHHRQPVLERKVGELPSRLERHTPSCIERIDRRRVSRDSGEDPRREFLRPLHIEVSERQA
jgi:hypothetical protein